MKIILPMVAVMLAVVIIAPTVQAKKHHLTNTEQEAGVANDKLGRPCTFGPSHDECHDQFLERTNNLPELPSNQHYGECEQDSKGLACDILNDDGSPNP